MSRVLHLVPRVAIFLAGIAAGALAGRRERSGADAPPDSTVTDLKESIKTLEARIDARLQTHETAVSERFQQVETRLEEHGAKLAEVPSTAQIVSAMEQILARS